jgi:hypothetical protein
MFFAESCRQLSAISQKLCWSVITRFGAFVLRRAWQSHLLTGTVDCFVAQNAPRNDTWLCVIASRPPLLARLAALFVFVLPPILDLFGAAWQSHM